MLMLTISGVVTQAGSGSSGLGLSIVKSLVKAHGGTIRVSSSSGCGASFKVLGVYSVCSNQHRANLPKKSALDFWALYQRRNQEYLS